MPETRHGEDPTGPYLENGSNLPETSAPLPNGGDTCFGVGGEAGLASETGPCGQVRLGHFLLEKRHAVGGLGEVWIGRDLNTLSERKVAIKVIKPDRLGSEMAVTRFRDERELAAQLEHPGIVPVYEVNQADDGTLYYVMKFVEGETLAERIRQYHRQQQAPEALRELLNSFVSLCQA